MMNSTQSHRRRQLLVSVLFVSAIGLMSVTVVRWINQDDSLRRYMTIEFSSPASPHASDLFGSMTLELREFHNPLRLGNPYFKGEVLFQLRSTNEPVVNYQTHETARLWVSDPHWDIPIEIGESSLMSVKRDAGPDEMYGSGNLTWYGFAERDVFWYPFDEYRFPAEMTFFTFGPEGSNSHTIRYGTVRLEAENLSMNLVSGYYYLQLTGPNSPFTSDGPFGPEWVLLLHRPWTTKASFIIAMVGILALIIYLITRPELKTALLQAMASLGTLWGVRNVAFNDIRGFTVAIDYIILLAFFISISLLIRKTVVHRG
jgi:hypothetical protein